LHSLCKIRDWLWSRCGRSLCLERKAEFAALCCRC
jgi:hypothetical protein